MRARPLLVALSCACCLFAHAALAAQPRVDDAKWSESYKAGKAALDAKDYRKAEKELLEALELIDPADARDPRRKQVLEGLVKLWMAEREWATAEPWLEKLVALDETVFGKDNLEVSYSLARLGTNRLQMGEYDGAEEAFARALKIRVEAKGPDHKEVASLWHNLGETFRRGKRLDKAEQLYLDALAMKTKALGPTHPSLATSLNDLGVVYNEEGKFSDALPRLREAKTLAAPLGETSPIMGSILHNLGDALAGTKSAEEAERAYKGSIAISEAQTPVDRPSLGRTLNNLGTLYQQLQRFDEAQAAYERAIEVRTLEFGPRDRSVKQSRLNLASLLERTGHLKEAEAIRAEYGR
ncbi:MAG: tetratricopeptide repeat protein [Deltaproteobacteria bacterium]|nr:tetratricopeptide repeat protein [Deltaproteobacteria bacterium]